MSSPLSFPELPKAPPSLKAELLITTPMFLGDGGQKATSIRPPSIKGALRFWWRALQWPRLYARHGHVATALKALHTEEADLFGRAAGHKGAHYKESKEQEASGQGRFRITVAQTEVAPAANYQPSQSVQYLLRQGLYHLRDPLNSDTPFAVTLTAKPGVYRLQDKQWKSLEEALLCWGLLGGLGARARKGLGSVSLQSLAGGAYQAPQNRADYEALLSRLLSPLQGQAPQLPPFTAFSSTSRVDIALEADQPSQALNMLVDEMQMYRAYGRNGEVNGRPAEQNFGDDHDLVLAAINGGALAHAPRRTVFGLPHNYYFSSAQEGFEISADWGNRRASPLLLHVHQLPTGKSLGVVTMLPAVFLPRENARLKVGTRRKSTLPLRSGDIDWTVLHDFLDRFPQRRTLVSASTPNPQEAQE